MRSVINIILSGVFKISTKTENFLNGCKNGIPIAFGYVPMGIGYAAIALQAGFSPLQTIGMSIFVYAGAGQIIAASMFLNGASIMAIILTNFVVNLRYFVMNTYLQIYYRLILLLMNHLQCFL